MTTQGQSTTPAGGNATSADLAASIDRIGQQVRELQCSYAATRTQFLLFSGLFVVLLLTFGVALVAKVRTNLDGEKLKTAALDRASLMMPKVQEQLLLGVRDAAPTYQKLVMARLPVVMPLLGNRVSHVAQEMAPQVSSEVLSQVEASFNRIETRLEKDLQTQFPKLDHQRLASLGEQLKQDMVLPSGQLAQHVKDLTEQELGRINGVLEKFPIDQYASLSEDQLGRALVHNLLMLVDHEVEATGTAAELDQQPIIVK